MSRITELTQRKWPRVLVAGLAFFWVGAAFDAANASQGFVVASCITGVVLIIVAAIVGGNE